MNRKTFLPADLLLPKDCDLTRWAVVASDQYTSQEEYWQEVEDFVGRAPSTLRVTLPESCLDGPDIETDIMAVNNAMSTYIRGDMFQHYDNSMIYVERTLDNGAVRKGFIGQIDLEEYDYTIKASSLIRSAETTVLPRIPPRVAARKNAPLEVSHVILLADDKENKIFQGIKKDSLEKLYDVELMEQGGSVSAWLLGEEELKKVQNECENLTDTTVFKEKYKSENPLLQFVMGDGNHSLATAKECYERQKKFAHPEDWHTLPSRYAMVELVNLHDTAVELLPVHRVLHNLDPQKFLREFRVELESFPENNTPEQDFTFYFGETTGVMTVKNPLSPFAVSSLHGFILKWLQKEEKTSVEYVEEKEEAILKGKKNNTLSIIIPQFNKEELFPTLIHQGILPPKSLTLGKPSHKRYYLEARRIRT